MRSAERRKENVLEMKCLRSLVGVSRIDRVRNEEVRTLKKKPVSDRVSNVCHLNPNVFTMYLQ